MSALSNGTGCHKSLEAFLANYAQNMADLHHELRAVVSSYALAVDRQQKIVKKVKQNAKLSLSPIP